MSNLKTLGLALLLTPSLMMAASDRPDIHARFSFEGDSFDSNLNKSRVFGAKANLWGKEDLLDNLSLVANAGFVLETGNTETVFNNNPYEPANQFFLNEAYVEFEPFSFINLKAGALNQSKNRAPLLLGGSSFIGLEEAFSYSNSGFGIALKMGQYLPSNRQLSRKLGKVDDGEARFFQETIELTHEWDYSKTSLRAMHFAYSDLSTSVAAESRLLGNTVIGNGAENAKFLTSFQGFDFGLDMEGSLVGGITGIFSAELVTNSKATSNNQARRLTLGGGYQFRDHNLIFKATTHQQEKNSVVAFYGNKKFGHANRRGMRIDFEYENLGQNFDLGLGMGKNTVLEKSFFQDDETIWSVSIGKNYQF